MPNKKTTKPVKLRIIFMGTSALAEKILSSLIAKNYNIVSVFTRSDKKAGREKELRKSPVKVLAKKNKIPIVQPKKFDRETVSHIKKLKPDIIIVVAYGKILPAEVLNIPGFGALNVHASLLPKYRGPSPIQNSILNGEKETGITIMLMDKGIDTGDILSQKKIRIGAKDTAIYLSEKLNALGPQLLLATIPKWIDGKINPQKQNETDATLCQLIERADGKIFWSEIAKNIYNKFRAFQPWPGVFTFWKSNGIKRIKLSQISISKDNPVKKESEGTVFQLQNKIAVQTGNGAIVLEKIQIEGKKEMEISEFIKGHPDFIGSVLK